MSKLECCEFQQELDEAIELRRPARAELHDHAINCDNCRSRWEEFIILEEAIPLWNSSVPQIDLTNSILAKLAEEDVEAKPFVGSLFTDDLNSSVDTPARHRSGLWSIATAIAASIAIAVSIFYATRPVEEQFVDTPSIEISPFQLPVFDRPEQTEYTLLVRDAGSAYLELASDAAAAITESTALLPNASLVAGSDSKPTRETPSWIRQVGNNLEPIGSDFEKAIDFLFKAPPPEPTPAT